MSDICPPLWTPRPCSCRGLRFGVALLTICGYSAAFSPVFFGKPLAAVVANALRGDVPVMWTGCALFGLLCLASGLYQIHRDGHGFKAGSLLWSVGVVALCAWRLANFPPSVIGSVGWLGIRIDAFDYQLARMAFVAWMASNAANIALNLFEVFGRRRPDEVYAPVPEPMPSPRGVLHATSRITTQCIEDIEGDGIEVDDLYATSRLGELRPIHIPGFIEHEAAPPKVTLVRDRDGNFIPAERPDREAVRVRRR